MKKKKLLYLFPTSIEHFGLKRKFEGQFSALSKRYACQSFFIHSGRHFFSQLWHLLIYEIKVLISILFVNKVYCRYNPKTVLSNVCMIGLSFFKPIYWEHNTKLDVELKLLNRYGEYCLNFITFLVLRFSRIEHVCVTNEILLYLKRTYLPGSKFLFVQNGYQRPAALSLDAYDAKVIDRILLHKRSFQTIGIFVGGGFFWHGVDEMINSLLKKMPSLGIVVVGDYSLDSIHPNVLVVSKQNISTIMTIYEYCDFGIGTFQTGHLNLKESSNLKVREYLVNGLPVLNFKYDTASEIDSLRPYMFNIFEDEDALYKIINAKVNRADLMMLAEKELSWNKLMRVI
ncbi:hypothetical protein DID77_02135 [Candidatus Marinamargulisbacteria bacterium SCGC AG-439-L15]|nr:hypothetical protein DID77_02135 [Candidatus Marinamargulisbacteria bacterium SCGC AG-439-L15]